MSKSYGDPSRRPECKVTISRNLCQKRNVNQVPCSPRQSNSSRRPSTCCGLLSPPSTSFAWTYPVPRWRPDTSRLSVIRWQKSWISYPATPGRRCVCLSDGNTYVLSSICKILQLQLLFQVAFITYDRSVHFYQMVEGASQPTQLNVSDIDGECQFFIGHSFSPILTCGDSLQTCSCRVRRTYW